MHNILRLNNKTSLTYISNLINDGWRIIEYPANEFNGAPFQLSLCISYTFKLFLPQLKTTSERSLWTYAQRIWWYYSNVGVW